MTRKAALRGQGPIGGNGMGVDVQAPTGATYTLTADDVGSLISVTVSYSDGAGYTETVRSAATAPVIAAGQIITGTPGPDDLPGNRRLDMILAARRR